jgi:hypothetical protein
MRRVVIDTNIYIDWLNVGRHEDVVFQRDAVKHRLIVAASFRSLA